MGPDPCFREKIAKMRTFSEEFSKTREYTKIIQSFFGNTPVYIYIDVSVYYMLISTGYRSMSAVGIPLILYNIEKRHVISERSSDDLRILATL